MAEIATLGPRAAVDLVYEVGGLDSDRILSWANRNGLTPQEIVGILAGGVGDVNNYLVNTWSGYFFITTADHMKYRQGALASKTPVSTEFDTADPIRGAETGHMLPMKRFKDYLAWTHEYLQDAYRSQIETDVEQVAERWLNRFESDIVTRVLTDTENAEGGGYDVGWAVGTGDNVNFIPPAFAGQEFTSSHIHYNYADGVNAAAAKVLIDLMLANMREHGFEGNLQLQVSTADVDVWAGMTGFVEIAPPSQTIIAVPSGSEIRTISGNASGIPGELFGYYKSKTRGVVELRSFYRIPTKYAWLTKSFGQNNPQNGVALRVHPNQPFGLAPMPEIDRSLQPRIAGIRLDGQHGVGVNRRLNGVAGYFNTGASAYVNPTIS
jgi:hypothetical protein